MRSQVDCRFQASSLIVLEDSKKKFLEFSRIMTRDSRSRYFTLFWKNLSICRSHCGVGICSEKIWIFSCFLLQIPYCASCKEVVVPIAVDDEGNYHRMGGVSSSTHHCVSCSLMRVLLCISYLGSYVLEGSSVYASIRIASRPPHKRIQDSGLWLGEREREIERTSESRPSLVRLGACLVYVAKYEKRG